jgi:hypothetical protein
MPNQANALTSNQFLSAFKPHQRLKFRDEFPEVIFDPVVIVKKFRTS